MYAATLFLAMPIKTRTALIAVKIDAATGAATQVFPEMRRLLEAHLPAQTAVTGLREDNGRYVYAGLQDYDCTPETNARNDAYIQGLIAGILLTQGFAVL